MHLPGYKHLLLRIKFILLLLSIFLNSSAQGNNTISTLKPPLYGIYVIAHRGVHDNIPENTLAAYGRAIDIGCDFVEIDVRTTLDGRIISMHNSRVDEYVKDVSGKVSEMTFDEIRALDIGSLAGKEWKGANVPSIEEILQLCKGKIGIYLDLKEASVDELVKTVRKYEMERETVWYLPYGRTAELLQLKEVCPECIVMPDPGKDENLQTVIERLNPEVVATDMNMLSPGFVKTAHDNGVLVFADENDGNIAEWKKMAGWKVDGIQTDEPQKLIAFLKSLLEQEASNLKRNPDWLMMLR